MIYLRLCFWGIMLTFGSDGDPLLREGVQFLIIWEDPPHGIMLTSIHKGKVEFTLPNLVS